MIRNDFHRHPYPFIRPVDHWVLHRTHPAFDDKESLTVLELVGRHTAKMNELIEVVNKSIFDINDTIEEFINGTNEDIEEFKVGVNQKIKDFKDVVEITLDSFRKDIGDSVIYIKENLNTYIANEFENALKELADNGELDENINNVLGGYVEDINNNITNIDTRLTKLENQELTLTYDEGTETLNIVITYPESEE